MKKIHLAVFGIAILFLGIIGFAFQQSTKNNPIESSKKLHVAATIFPLYDIVRTVGGETVEATLLLPPGTSPHVFDPTPSTIKALSDARQLYSIGHGLDNWAQQLAEQTNTEVIVVDKGLALHAYEEENHATEFINEHDTHHDEEVGHEDHDHHKSAAHLDHEGHDHGSTDPHYWLDPENAVIIAMTIANKLSEADPLNASHYEARANAFADTLAKLNVEWQTQAQLVHGEPFLTFHDAFHYFADHFGFTIAASIEPFPGKEPTPQYLQVLHQNIEQHSAKGLFLEPQLSSSVVDSFAADSDIPIGTLDPLGGVEGRMSYSALIAYNVQTIVETIRKN